MNCAEWERLLDAYLDRQLAGALRLEFDAHRLSCRRCQQTLSMMEACEHVIAGDKPPGLLSEDFTDQVMVQIGAARPKTAQTSYRGLRLWTAGSLVAAAAVWLLFAYVPGLRSGGSTDTPNVTPQPVAGNVVVHDSTIDPWAPGIDKVEQHERAFALIAGRVEQRVRASLASGNPVPADVVRMAQYLNIDLPADIAGHKVDFATVNPIGGIFFEMLAPPPAADRDDAEPVESAEHTRI